MIVLDVSTVIGAVIRRGSVPDRAVRHALAFDDVAVAARADAIVTGDADLLVLHPWRGTRIVRPAEYLALVADDG